MAAFCTSCGEALKEGLRFCTACGAPVAEAAALSAGPSAPDHDLDYDDDQLFEPAPPRRQPPPVMGERPARRQPPPVMEERPARRSKAPSPGSPYAPISTWGFVGTMLLLSIPIVGLVLAIVWAAGGCRKINKRNLSRAFLILMAVGLIFGLISGLVVRSVVKSALREAGLSEDMLSGGLGGLAAMASASGEGGDAAGMMEGLGALAALGAMSGGSGGSGELAELEQLAEVMEGLEGLTGEEGGAAAIGELVDNVEDANARAEAINDGWPATLRPYPGGQATAVASYRTEISGSSVEEMKGWIEQLKGDGFAFEDFYDFGFSEEDMLGMMNAWWGTDGSIYLSVSYVDGLVTIDHTKELPDIESYFN